jgi:hypothetical protein
MKLPKVNKNKFTGARIRRSSGRSIDLNGIWKFSPNSVDINLISPNAMGEDIKVPGLWEANGYLELDGPATYRRSFTPLKNMSQQTIRFCGVMDSFKFWINGNFAGHHNSAFTTSEFLITEFLNEVENDIVVEVIDHVRESNEHLNNPHGKQGWANHEFQSPPSLYMTYGGIYQPIELFEHNILIIRDISAVNKDRELEIEVVVENLGDILVKGIVELKLLDLIWQVEIKIMPQSSYIYRKRIETSAYTKWDIDNPVLEVFHVKVQVGEEISDEGEIFLGIRDLRIKGKNIYLNDEQIFIKSVLVQGFYPKILYAEPSDEEIFSEVRTAKELGFNTLRLHVKAFDPRYLDICDQVGMLVHCDIPIAEPIDYRNLDSESEFFRNCVDMAIGQISRDRSHPSIVIWSATNEIGIDGSNIRESKGYSDFMRELVNAILKIDSSRPLIENDWIDPELTHVYKSDIVTSHWYGRLTKEYLLILNEKCILLSELNKPFMVTEFGDWGISSLDFESNEFWSYRDYYFENIQSMPWSETLESFAEQTQQYQGVSNRLQIEVFRGSPVVKGYCLTELTDVPWELNGVLDFSRNLKKLTGFEMKLANQPVLPICIFDYSGAWTNSELQIEVKIHNTKNYDIECKLTLGFRGESQKDITVITKANSVASFGTFKVPTPVIPGKTIIECELSDETGRVGFNQYAFNLYSKPENREIFAKSISELSDRFIRESGVILSENSNLLIIGQDEMSEFYKSVVTEHLRKGGSALILAQSSQSASYIPIEVSPQQAKLEWGATDFHFTGTALPSIFDGGKVLNVEDYAISPNITFSKFGTSEWPDTTYVGLFRPMPREQKGYILGSGKVLGGKLFLCQYIFDFANLSMSSKSIFQAIILEASKA